jgi:hypothetical protein
MEIKVNTHNGESKPALVSPEDYDEIIKYKWAFKHGYLYASVNRKTIAMHNFIMHPQNGFIVDHINRIRHDNRRENLRFLTLKENSQNRSKRPKYTSIYRGVSFYTRYNKFVTHFRLNYKLIHLGYHVNEIDAAEAFDTYVAQNNLIHELNFKEKRDEYLKRPKILTRVGKFSKYYGVSKFKKKFQATAFNNYLGRYDTEVEAANVVDNYIIQQKFNRPLNFPENHPDYCLTKLTYVILDNGVFELVKNDCKTGILIDEKDYEQIKNMTMTINSQGYVQITNGIPLHRYLMGVTDTNIFIDHIDGNPKNNQRSNLRLSNAQLNAKNRKKKEGTTSKFYGVCKKGKNTWKAYITVEGSLNYFGTFNDEEFAARARDLFIIKNHSDQHYNYNFKWTPEEITEWQQKLANK